MYEKVHELVWIKLNESKYTVKQWIFFTLSPNIEYFLHFQRIYHPIFMFSIWSIFFNETWYHISLFQIYLQTYFLTSVSSIFCSVILNFSLSPINYHLQHRPRAGSYLTTQFFLVVLDLRNNVLWIEVGKPCRKT